MGILFGNKLGIVEPFYLFKIIMFVRSFLFVSDNIFYYIVKYGYLIKIVNQLLNVFKYIVIDLVI